MVVGGIQKVLVSPVGSRREHDPPPLTPFSLSVQGREWTPARFTHTHPSTHAHAHLYTMPPLGTDRNAAYETAVVLDLGGSSLKAGLAAAFPTSAEPRVVSFGFFYFWASRGV